MYYYSYELYMAWHNWYYGIGTVGEEPVILNAETPVEKTPHDFPSCNFTQATLNEAIIASINDPPPPPLAKAVHFEIKKIDTKKKKKKARKHH
jgi:hypothetical protein